MSYTMINLHDAKLAKSLEGAVARCRKQHPKVRRIDENHVAVSSSDKTKYYTVRIKTLDTRVLAECNCEAHSPYKPAVVCYHMIAALAAPIVPVKYPLAGILVKNYGDDTFRIDGWVV